MDSTADNPQLLFNEGLVYLFAWLTGHVAYFGDNVRALPKVEDWLNHVDNNGKDATTANQHYTLVQVLRGGQIVATGFFQCSGRNVGINLLGVKDSAQRSNVSNQLLAWYLSGLPFTAAGGNVMLGTLQGNTGMRAWCARFGGTEEPRDDAVIIRFDIAAACQRLNCDIPHQAKYAFSDRFGDLEFHVVYAGYHPNFVDPAYPPIANEHRSVW